VTVAPGIAAPVTLSSTVTVYATAVAVAAGLGRYRCHQEARPRQIPAIASIVIPPAATVAKRGLAR